MHLVTDDDLHASLDRFHRKLDRDIQSAAFPSLRVAPGAQGQGASFVIPSGDAPVLSFNLDACFRIGEA